MQSVIQLADKSKSTPTWLKKHPKRSKRKFSWWSTLQSTLKATKTNSKRKAMQKEIKIFEARPACSHCLVMEAGAFCLQKVQSRRFKSWLKSGWGPSMQLCFAWITKLCKYASRTTLRLFYAVTVGSSAMLIVMVRDPLCPFKRLWIHKMEKWWRDSSTQKMSCSQWSMRERQSK